MNQEAGTDLSELEQLWWAAAQAEETASRSLDAAEEQQRDANCPDPHFSEILNEFRASRDANAGLRQQIARFPARSIYDAMIKARVAVWCYGGEEEDVEAQLAALIRDGGSHEPCASTMSLVLALDLVRLRRREATTGAGASPKSPGSLALEAVAQAECELADEIGDGSKK
jgi:hypothetical protein